MKKIDVKKIFFLVIIIVAMVAIFTVTKILISEQENLQSPTSHNQPINQIKVKAESKTYSRTLALNPANNQNTTPILTLTPTSTPTSPSPTPTYTPTPTLTPTPNNTPTSSISNEENVTPTPTEIILAYNTSTEEGITDQTPTATPVASLPESGNILPSLMILGFFLIILMIFLVY